MRRPRMYLPSLADSLKVFGAFNLGMACDAVRHGMWWPMAMANAAGATITAMLLLLVLRRVFGGES